MNKTISLILLLLCALIPAQSLRAADNGTEFFLEDDLTVYGTGGTATDPDVEMKGFSVFGSTQTSYIGAAAAPGNMVVNGVLAVSSGAYFVGDSTFTAAQKIFVNDGSAGQLLQKTASGNLVWVSSASLGDGLGNHTAATALNMSGWSVVNVSSVNFSPNVFLSSGTAAQLGGVYLSSNAYIVGVASAAKYYGDGSGLTGVAATSLSGTLPVANGGTGAATLTGILKGNGTSAVSAMTGTANYTARWSNATTLAAGIIYDDTFKVGVGVPSPAALLQVGAASYNAATAVFQVGGGSLTVLTDGNVGIGTIAPAHRLEITGGNVNVVSGGLYTGGIERLTVGGDLVNGGVYKSNAANIHVFQHSDGSEKMRIHTNGNVGIGTASPNYRLEISSGAGESGVVLAVSTGTSVIFGVKGNGEVAAGKYFGDGSGLTGVVATDASKLPLTGGALTGTLSVFSDTVTMSTDVITTGIMISTGGAIQTIGVGHGGIPGDPRGLGAIDLQTARNAGVQAATGLYSVISGGRENRASGPYSAVGGGIGNISSLTAGFVGAGMYNNASGNEAAVAGGYGNIASGDSSFIGSGMNNRVSGQYGVVAGGYNNSAAEVHSAVAGGWNNSASGMDSFVGGGQSNHADGSYSVIPGGVSNSATAMYSFAAGYKSSSTAAGTFTWSDSQGVETINAVPDQAMFKAAGGFWVSTGTVHATPGLFVDPNNNVGIGTDTPVFKLEVAGGAIKAAGGLILETRTSDPGAPVIGQTWIRTDIP